MPYPQIPAGYHAFTGLMGTLTIQRSLLGITHGWLANAMDACPIGHGSTRTSFETLQWWLTDPAPRAAVRDQLGTMLVSGTLRAAGLCAETGALHWLPATCWQVDPGPDAPGGPNRSMVDMACDRGRVRTSNLPDGRTYVPIFALRALAEALGAKSLPPAPGLEPDEIPALDPSPTRPDLPAPARAFNWTACEAFTWVAFREARKLGDYVEFPKTEWSRNWKRWPAHYLSNALCELGNGKPWVPSDDDWPPPDPADARRHAEVMMVETGETPRHLNDALAADHKMQRRHRELLNKAMCDVLAGVRHGQVTMRARPTHKNGSTNISAVHVNLDPALLLGPRCITLFGKVEYDKDVLGLDRLLEYEGPWFDEARFCEAEMRALWPAAIAVPLPDPWAKPRWSFETARDWIAKHASMPTSDAARALRDAVERGKLAVWGQAPGRDAAGNPTSEGQGALMLVPQDLLNGELRNPDVGFDGGVLGPRPGTAAWNRNHNQLHRCWYSKPGVPGYVLGSQQEEPARYPLYAGMCFEATDVQRLWPSVAATSDDASAGQPAPALLPTRPVPAAKLKAEYARFVKGHMEAGTRPTVPETRVALNLAFVGYAPITDQALRALRAHAPTPPDWRKEGRHRVRNQGKA